MKNILTRQVIFEKTSQKNKKMFENRKKRLAEKELLKDSVFTRYQINSKGILEEVLFTENVDYLIKRAIKLKAKFIITGWLKENKRIKNQFILIAFNNEDLYSHSKFCYKMGFYIETIRNPKDFAQV